MTDDNTTLDTDNAETSEPSELEDVAATVEEIAAADSAGESDGTADTVVEDDFEPTDTQIALAKQLGFSDEYAGGMTEAQAEAADQFGRAQSRLQQRKGNPVQKKDEEVESVSVESSTDDKPFIAEDELFTDEGVEKINDLHRRLAAQEARDKSRDDKHNTSEQDRLQTIAEEVFDALDPEFFPDFSPGESAEIGQGSPAEEAREEVVSMAKAIQGGSTKGIPLKEAIEQALTIIAPTETQNAAEHKANAGRKKRRSQRISAPSSSSTKRKKVYATPEEEAVDKIFDYVNG